MPLLPVRPGVDVVGTVEKCSEDVLIRYGLRSGGRVASLIQWGGNSRYVTVSAKQLVKVSRDINPAKAACLLENYLTAFQSLHLSDDWENKYRRDSLRGKRLLIIGGMSMIGQAMVELALTAGATKVYTPARREHHSYLYLL